MPCYNCVDSWEWIATYRDGSSLRECDGTQHHGFAEVDRHLLASLTWLPREASLRPLYLDCSSTTVSPTLFRQRIKVMSMDTGTMLHTTVHCLGWQKGDDAYYMFAFDDGTMLASNDINAGVNWFDKV